MRRDRPGVLESRGRRSLAPKVASDPHLGGGAILHIDQNSTPDQTWDGLPISADPPYGAAIVVAAGIGHDTRYLILHRAFKGANFDGDWAWGPPSGARMPGEAIEACAARELEEETGLRLPLRAVPDASIKWSLFWAHVPAVPYICLSAEHDRFEWVPLEEACQRSKPDEVARSFTLATEWATRVASMDVTFEITGIDHVQLAAPRGCEVAGRRFYGDVLGLLEVEKPEPLRSRGGAWFQCGAQQIHIGVEDDFRPARKAHPAFRVRNLHALRARLKDRGIPYTDDTALPGVDRFYVSDPFGNRLEFAASDS